MRIADIPVPNRAFLAPMAGVTDVVFRRLAHRFGAGLVVSEMVAGEQLADGNADTRLRSESAGVDPHVVQLAGREARWMAEGARMAEGAGAAIIDINMGCPAKKVTSGYSGSALMRDPDHALTLIEATVAAVKVPVTLKMRLGWDDDSINAPELAARAEAAGVAMITVHGRTRCQFYKGSANWDAIRLVRERISVPLVANGDCQSAEDARQMLARSGADAVMIGRASFGRPWLPGTIGAALDGTPAPRVPAGPDLADLICEHAEGIFSHYGTEKGVRNARKHIAWYLDGAETPMPAEQRRELLTATVPAQVLAMLRSWFSSTQMGVAA
ncbi:tRNA-dihydrouridine synthase [Stappia taiwanensis]|nr:tRNA dihydrouridine synthase DusB [Stappia taiwanensis]GGE79740.1 tRNA-dihydrouridine synthase [Stappia taiwanensis]